MTSTVPGTAHRGRFVVVIDLEAAYRTKVERYLTEAGHEAAGFDDVRAALQKMFRRVPDLAVIDLGMPAGAGIGLYKAMRKDARTARVPCLFVSRGGHPLELGHGIKLGRHDVLKKPFTRRRFAAALVPLLTRLDRIEALGRSGRFRTDTRVLDLHDVLGLIRAFRLTGRLRLVRGNRGPQAEAFFLEGRLVHAVQGDARGGRVLLEVMLWSSARYDFHPEPRSAVTRLESVSREAWAETLAALELLDRGRLNPFPLRTTAHFPDDSNGSGGARPADTHGLSQPTGNGAPSMASADDESSGA